MLLSFLAALALEVGALAGYMSRPWSASFLFTLGIAIVRRGFAQSDVELRKRRRWPVIVLPLTLFMSYQGVRWFTLPWRAGGGQDASTRKIPPDKDDAAAHFGGSYTGVIIVPEQQPHVVLIAPLPAFGHALFTAKRVNPITIPFYGAYWLFQFPDRKPPRNSLTSRGSPDRMKFRSVAHIPLIMEAHQNLGPLIDFSCCSSIDIGIRNADHFPGTVSLELALVNTTLPTKPSQFVGSVGVESTPQWALDDPAPVSQTLRFPMPRDPAFPQFDELSIRFRLKPIRADHSARIAIEHFTLNPRR